jgi:ribonucleoside-diphosphate reductase alpha chain
MGGRASGPQPLIDLMNFTRDKMLAAQGRQLTALEMHDIICQIGLIVVAGGVRRSALISLSELKDANLRDAKAGEFWEQNGQRSMANNSAVYESKPSAADFLDEWTALVKSGTGERGIFNRGGLETQVPARRWEKIKNQVQVGVNPCGEIYLRSKQFCNLTSIVVRPDDTMSDLKRKMRLATILGTYQATLTDFGYLGDDWKKNCEEEQLLGVSITGYFDNEIVRNDDNLDALREESITVNEEYAARFGANPSTAITCVKPHGNSGQLLYVGSGMHTWFAPYYIRRVRISVNDPLMKMIQDQGIPVLPEVGYSTSTASTMVMEFPIKAPEGALTNHDVSALDMLHEWKRLKTHFTEHNPSVTIYAENDDWTSIADFIYKNWDDVGGLSFLPRSEHVYQLAPYEEITEEEYNTRKEAFKDIDFSKLSDYEHEDETTGAKELACAGGNCEV